VLGKMTPTLIFIFKEKGKKKKTDVIMPCQGVGKWVWGVGVNLAFHFILFIGQEQGIRKTTIIVGDNIHLRRTTGYY
jgi:hypothetical protein